MAELGRKKLYLLIFAGVAMFIGVIVVIVCLLPLNSNSEDAAKNPNESEAIVFLAKYNREFEVLVYKSTIAGWNYSTNITDHNEKLQHEMDEKVSNFEAKSLKIASQFDSSNFSSSTKRQLKSVGKKPLEEREEKELQEIKSFMGKIYGSTKVCVKDDNQKETCHNLEPGLYDIMSKSKDPQELNKVWKEWRRLVGQTIKPKYERFVDLKNKRARRNGYKDLGDEWRQKYETKNFEQEVLNIYKQMEPLYKELHAYVRRKLYDKFGKDFIDLKGPIPANAFGNMWGRFWNNIYKDVIPFPDKTSVDPSEELKKQNYTVEKMFRTGDDFYASMGLIRVPDSFWTKSMLRKPDDGRQVVCHATAWDFYNKKDFRIRMCTRDYNFEDLNTLHHELGHIQYFLQYKDQPIVFRDGANDGFHEAIGELMAMAGATPKHLHEIGLIKELVEDDEQDVNFLMSQALITISTLPFHLVNDLWRWKVFRGEIPKQDWNKEFWKMKEKILGVKSPVPRSENDLDPPTLFHINQDYDMIRYFTRTILQFQFAESLCRISGHTGPLHRCDFSGSHEAGAALAKMLRLGSSKPWPDALEQLTGERKMSSRPILKFFEPLHKWLLSKNKENGDQPGWN